MITWLICIGVGFIISCACAIDEDDVAFVFGGTFFAAAIAGLLIMAISGISGSLGGQYGPPLPTQSYKTALVGEYAVIVKNDDVSIYTEDEVINTSLDYVTFHSSHKDEVVEQCYDGGAKAFDWLFVDYNNRDCTYAVYIPESQIYQSKVKVEK